MSETVLCQAEEATHPLGTAILDGLVRAARDGGTIKTKSDCYQWADVHGAAVTVIAAGVGGVLGGFLGGAIGAAVGFNANTLGHCICDRYF
jgi:hypothetical protein